MAKPQPSIAAASGGSRRAILGCFIAVCIAVPASFLISTHRAGFDAARLPDDYTHHTISVPNRHSGILRVSERVGEGRLPGPEDLAYDAGSGFLYTGCDDGWIRRVKLPEESGGGSRAEVEEWAHVGGRPLGLAFGPDKQLVVAEAYKGLLAIAGDGTTVRLLADEAEGVHFALTDGVDVASDGTIYFTDASHKYNLAIHLLDILEGRPYGRLLSFDPASNRTTVLLRGLYFANGVAISPDQASLIYCETPLRRCRRYHIHGEKKGTVDHFIDNLPGFPDNIRYDGDGHFWIGLVAGKSRSWDMIQEYPWLRKMMAVGLQMLGGAGVPLFTRGSSVLCASVEGEPLALYTDKDLELVTVGLKIGKHLYYGSLVKPYISRIGPVPLAAGGE